MFSTIIGFVVEEFRKNNTFFLWSIKLVAKYKDTVFNESKYICTSDALVCNPLSQKVSRCGFVPINKRPIIINGLRD